MRIEAASKFQLNKVSCTEVSSFGNLNDLIVVNNCPILISANGCTRGGAVKKMLKTQPDSLARSPEQDARHKWFGLDFNFCMLKGFCVTRKLNSVSISRANHHRSP